MKKVNATKIMFLVASNILVVCMLLFLSAMAFKDSKQVFKLSDEVFYSGDTTKNNVSLMINVYGGEEYLDDMLNTLDECGVKATFFVGGVWATKHPEELCKIFERGHEIANHGFYHKDQDKLNLKQNISEIENNHKLVKEIVGVDMKLFAPPSGAYSKATVDAAKSLGYEIVMWSKDTIDWRDQDVNLIIKRASTKNKNGDLILMHPTKATSQALKTIITNILSQNFKIVCVSQNISFNIV